MVELLTDEECHDRNSRAGDEKAPAPAWPVFGIRRAGQLPRNGGSLLHVSTKPLARGSEHPGRMRSQKPSPTCRFILWSFARDLRRSGSVVLGKLEADRELLKPVKTEALLA